MTTRMPGATPIKPEAPTLPSTPLVRVPRGVITKYAPMPWDDLLAAAERGDDGLQVTTSKEFGFSYYREGDKGGLLEGKSSLFCQGWVAL